MAILNPMRVADMHTVDPSAGKIGKRCEVFLAGKNLRLEAPYLTGRGSVFRDSIAAYDPPHGSLAFAFGLAELTTCPQGRRVHGCTNVSTGCSGRHCLFVLAFLCIVILQRRLVALRRGKWGGRRI
jgi:hypothetical protein